MENLGTWSVKRIKNRFLNWSVTNCLWCKPGFSQLLQQALQSGALIYLGYWEAFYAELFFKNILLLLLWEWQCHLHVVTWLLKIQCSISPANRALSLLSVSVQQWRILWILYLFLAITTGIVAGSGMYVLALYGWLWSWWSVLFYSQTAERKILLHSDPLF